MNGGKSNNQIALFYVFSWIWVQFQLFFYAIYVEKERFPLKNISKLFFLIHMARYMQKTKQTPFFLLSLSFSLFIFI